MRKRTTTLHSNYPATWWMAVILVFSHMALKAQDYSRHTPAVPASGKGQAQLVDVNLDGYQDVFLSGEDGASGIAAIYLNNGDTSFTDLGVAFPWLRDGDAIFTDINQDALPDLILTGKDTEGNYLLKIFLNFNGSSFTVLEHEFTGYSQASLAAADINGDGYPDFMACGLNDAGICTDLYLNNGGNGFTRYAYTFTPAFSGDLAIRDINRDNRPDIIYTGLKSNFAPGFFIYLNRGKLLFEELETNIPGCSEGVLAFPDVNADGYPEISICGKNNSDEPVHLLFQNNQGLGFPPLQTTARGFYRGAQMAMDYNADGYGDLLIAGRSADDLYHTLLYQSNGTTLELESDTLDGLLDARTDWGDINLDGRPDFWLKGSDMNHFQNYFYTSNKTAGTPPEAPDELHAAPGRDSVVLRWAVPGDAEQLQGFTYDLALWTNASAEIRYTLPVNPQERRYDTKQGAFSDTSLQISDLPEGKYYWQVQAVDLSGAGSALSQKDSFYIALPLDLGNDTSICFGDSLSLEVDALADSLHWHRNSTAGAPFSKSPQIVHSVRQKDTLICSLFKASGTTVRDSIIVDVLPLPRVSFPSDTSLCTGSLLELELSDSLASANWSSTGAMPTQSGLFFSATIYEEDTLLVQFTDSLGCHNRDSLPVQLWALPQSDLPADTTICHGDSLHLSHPVSADSVNWSIPGSSYTWNNSQQLALHITSDSIIRQELFNSYGCRSTQNLQVNSRALPVFSAGTDTLICPGDTILVGPAKENSSWTYQWESSGQLLNTAQGRTSFTAQEDETLVLSVSDSLGCLSTDSIRIAINPPGRVDIGPNWNICPGEAVRLGGDPVATGSLLPYRYQWTPATGLSDPATARPTATPESTTSYQLEVYAGSCFIDRQEVEVTVWLLPDIEISPDTTVGYEEELQLIVSGGVACYWEPAGQVNDPYSPTPLVRLQESTRFTAEVTDNNGCSDTASVMVHVKNEIFVPALFTPNGDLRNDRFRVYGFGIAEIELRIYSAQGELLYREQGSSMQPLQGWDGRHKGSPVKEGRYLWKITGKMYDGTSLEFKGSQRGTLMLLR